MKRKYPLRQRVHPEILLRSEFFSPTLRAIGMVADSQPPERQCSGLAQQYLLLLGDDDVTHPQLFWALHRWVRCGKPLYYLDHGLAEALTHTDFPGEAMWENIQLPDESFYLVLPPLFALENDQTGDHVIEGVYVVRDDVMVPRNPDGTLNYVSQGKTDGRPPRAYVDDPRFARRLGISLVAVGMPKGYLLGLEDARDDALVSSALVGGQPFSQNYKYGGVEEVYRIVVNLLYLLQFTRQAERERVVPEVDVKGGRERNIRRAVEEVERKGKSLTPYTVLRLQERPRVAPTAETTPRSERRTKYRSWVAGHFHSYWVLKPGKDQVAVETREGKGGTLHRVVRFLTPYPKGAGLPERPRNIVVKP